MILLALTSPNSEMKGFKNSPHKKLRKVDRSHAEIILRVRQYFENERSNGVCSNLQRVVDRTAKATGVSTKIVNKIRKAEGIEEWQADPGTELQLKRESKVPEVFSALVRKVIRDLFLAKNKFQH